MKHAQCNRLGYGGHEFMLGQTVCVCGHKDTRTMHIKELAGRDRNYRMEARLDYRETDHTLPGVVPGYCVVAVIAQRKDK